MVLNNNRISEILPRVIGVKFFLILLVSISISITSCDESSVVGLDVQPAGDILGVDYQDTTTLITKTVRVDSLRTDERLIILGNVLLGKYIDPVFGASTSSIYTQLRLPTNISDSSFGVSPICDGIYLSLVYEGTDYGSKARVQQKVNVYQVLEDISNTSNYYSNKTLSTSTLDLTNGGYMFTPNPANSETIAGVTTKNPLRIPLSIPFGQMILDNQNTGNLLSNTAFQAFLKGLYITTENSALASGKGNISHFNMGLSKLIIYYHNPGGPPVLKKEDLLNYELSFGSVARFSYFTHDYSVGIDANLAAQLSTSPPPPAQNDLVFIQSMAGVKTTIELPYLMNWINSGDIAINKAELVIKVDPTSTYLLDTFAAPTKLVLFGINDDGTNYVLPDANEGDNYFGGTYNSTTHEYRFNIARYIQQVLTGKRKNNGLHLLAGSGAINANRVVIGGGGSSSLYRMKLNIGYTKLQ